MPSPNDVESMPPPEIARPFVGFDPVCSLPMCFAPPFGTSCPGRVCGPGSASVLPLLDTANFL